MGGAVSEVGHTDRHTVRPSTVDDLLAVDVRTQADLDAVVLARNVFLGLLYSDARVRAATDSWLLATRLLQPAIALATAREAIETGEDLTADEIAEVCRTMELFRRRLHADHVAALPILRDCVRRDLGLRWIWLTFGLRYMARARVCSLVSGEKVSIYFKAGERHESAPAITFQTREGETRAELLRRLEALQRAVLDETATLPTGRQADRLRKRKTQSSPDHALARHVQWFYYCRVSTPPVSVRRMAREAGVEPAAVRYGITRAFQVLNSVPFIYTEPGEK